MWLLAEYFIGLLGVIQGLYFSDALEIDTHRDPCIAKILSCDYYRQPFSPYKYRDIGMFTKIEDLNKACKEQAAYNRCLMRAENSCEQSIFSPMVEEMIKNRRFSIQICRPASPWQQLYLKEASCLNTHSRKAFLYCFVKFIGIDKLNLGNTLELGCRHGKAIVDCSASKVQEKCGYFAGHILMEFLNFHSLSAYKCLELKPEDAKDNSFSFTTDYDNTETIFNVLKTTVPSKDFENKATDYKANTNIDETKLDNLEKQTSPYDTISENLFTPSDFNQPPTEETLTTVKYSLFESLDSDAELQDITESDQFNFPALPKYDYIHKNRTTFALYEDKEMGHTRYIGCGEADFFWVILSPLGSKYCILTDLKSEYSESIFKCTVKIDVPCSPEMDNKDISKKAEVYHHRYIATVLTPQNNQRAEDMVVINVHYLKLYPFPSKYVVEKKVNLWTTEANTVNNEQTESVRRTGPLEEDNHIEIIYQHGNGSGEKWHTPTHLDDDENEECENWDYYPLEEEDDIVPELLTNNIIYIEDDNGDLIYLHDRRSPIYSKSTYQPHSLFRPRTGEMPTPTEPRHLDEVEIKKLVQQSIYKEQASELLDGLFVSQVKSGQLEYCSTGAPCDANSEIVSESGTKPGMHIPSQKIKTIDPLKGVNQFLQRIPSSTKLNAPEYIKPFSFSEVYVINPSTEIGVSISTIQTEIYKDELVTERGSYLPEDDEFATGCSVYPSEDEFVTHPSRGRFSEEDEFVTHPSRGRFSEEDGFVTDGSKYSVEEDKLVSDLSKLSPEEDDFATGHFRYPPKEESYDKDITNDSGYLDPNYSSSMTSSQNSVDSKTDYMEQSTEHYFDEFNQPSYKYLQESTDAKVNPKETIHLKYLKDFPQKIENEWEKYLANIIRSISKALLKSEMFSQQELLDEAFITLLERAESILNL